MKIVKDKKGLTLVEMLVCVITLLMVGAICATGTGISIKSYQESRFESNSQMLQSSIETVLSDILRYASNVTTTSEGVVDSFDNLDYGMIAGTVMISPSEEGSTEKRFVIERYAGASEMLMLSHNAYAGDLYVDDFKLEYNSGTNVFSGSYTIKSKTMSNDYVKHCSFYYRTIMDKN